MVRPNSRILFKRRERVLKIAEFLGKVSLRGVLLEGKDGFLTIAADATSVRMLLRTTIRTPAAFQRVLSCDKLTRLLTEAEEVRLVDEGRELEIVYKEGTLKRGSGDKPDGEWVDASVFKPCSEAREVDLKTLVQAAEWVSRAIGDRSRWSLNNLWLVTDKEGCGRIVATDGKRLHFASFEEWEDEKFLIDRWGIQVLKQLPEEHGKFRIVKGPNPYSGEEEVRWLEIQAGGLMVWLKEDDGQIPDWESVLPQKVGARLKFEASDFEALIKTARKRLIGRWAYLFVQFELEGNEARCFFITDAGERFIPARLPFEVAERNGDLRARFNAEYVEQAIKGMNSTEFILQDEVSAGMISDGKLNCVLMPVEIE